MAAPPLQPREPPFPSIPPPRRPERASSGRGSALGCGRNSSFSSVEVASVYRFESSPSHGLPRCPHRLGRRRATSDGSFGVAVDGIVPIVGSHTYAIAGDYPLTITVNYHELICAPRRVWEPAQGLRIRSCREATATYSVGIGQSLNNLNVGVFTDANTVESASAFSATVYWGDGSYGSATVVGAAGTFTVEGSHYYSYSGDYVVSVVVQDAGGSVKILTAVNVLQTAEGILATPPQAVIVHGDEPVDKTIVAWGDDSPDAVDYYATWSAYYYDYGDDSEAYPHRP